MPKSKFTFKQRQMILSAEKMLDEASAGYVDILKEHIEQLTIELSSGDLSKSVLICHRIHSQAGTFGWPLMTEVSGWFKRLLISQQEKGINKKVNSLFMDSFEHIISNQLKAESENAVKLLQSIEGFLKEENIR